jgi:hypothetical protein
MGCSHCISVAKLPPTGDANQRDAGGVELDAGGGGTEYDVGGAEHLNTGGAEFLGHPRFCVHC